MRYIIPKKGKYEVRSTKKNEYIIVCDSFSLSVRVWLMLSLSNSTTDFFCRMLRMLK